MQNIRWKIITIVTILIVFAAIGIYPIVAARFGVTTPGWLTEKKLKLGLDLKGGVHLVLRVRTDEALKVETESEMERLRDLMKQRGISANVTSPDYAHFRVEGVPPDKDQAFKDAANELGTTFDRSAGVGGTYVFSMKPNAQ